MKANLSSLHKCAHCELNFLSKEGMEKHSSRVHESKTTDFTRYKCEKCQSDFKSKPDFKQHKMQAKSTGSCSTCLKAGGESPKFANICEYTAHRNSHSDEQVGLL
jgi:DNA-directed RNA polymerase subunit RPC12/RpoP